MRYMCVVFVLMHVLLACNSFTRRLLPAGTSTYSTLTSSPPLRVYREFGRLGVLRLGGYMLKTVGSSDLFMLHGALKMLSMLSVVKQITSIK